jgi:hypothetical protein
VTDDRQPVIPSVETDRVGILAAYVRSNRDRFTEDALRRAAQEAGYDASEIDAAFKAAVATAAIPSDAPRRSTPLVIAVAIGYLVVVYLGLAAVASNWSDGLIWVLAAVLLVSAIAWIALRDDRPSLSAGIGWGLILSLAAPFVIVLAVLGICVVTGYPLTG